MFKISALIFAMVLLTPVVYAQSISNCMAYADLNEFLTIKHQEKIVGQGMSKENLAQFWKSESGSWSYVLTYPNGISCIMAVGSDWETITYVKEDPKT